jgi:hypothetical protein
MNALLLGLKVGPNMTGAVLDHSNPNGRLRRGPNHSYGLDGNEIVERYSRTLIELVKECLIREPLDRPISVMLARRARDGYQAAIQVARGVPQLSANIRGIRFVGLTQPEPPQAWLNALEEPADTTGGPFTAPAFPIR